MHNHILSNLETNMDERQIQELAESSLLLDSLWDVKIEALHKVSIDAVSEISDISPDSEEYRMIRMLSEGLAKLQPLIYFVPRPSEVMPEEYSANLPRLHAICGKLFQFIGARDISFLDREMIGHFKWVIATEGRPLSFKTIQSMTITLESGYKFILGAELYERYKAQMNQALEIFNAHRSLLKSQNTAEVH